VSFFLETILQSHGYTVHCAGDAEQAMELFKKYRNDVKLVFTDIGLPKVDGITLSEKLRTLKPNLPIIVASGYPTKEYKERLNELKPQAFLSKPYNTNDILQTIRKALNGSMVLHLAS
jgi:two-component system cell cycle sensor histidine kinase/response regulator CckA